MSKKRKRSEVSEADSEEFPVDSKRQCGKEWTVRSELNSETDLCSKLFDFLRKYKDTAVSHSCLSEFLFRAPSRRLQADYYDVITNPIDLLRIQQKIKTCNYKTVQDFLNDIKLLFDNAKSYYTSSADEYRAADSLERAFLKHLSEFGFSIGRTPSPFSSLTLRIPKTQLSSSLSSQRTSSSSESSISTSRSTPTSIKPSKPTSASKVTPKTTRSRAWIDEYLSSSNPQKIYIARVYNFRDSSGDCVADVFHALPSRKQYPEYYRVITEPIDLCTIKKNVDSGVYVSLKALQDDMILMIKNAHYFNEPGSVLFKKASSLRKFVINKGAELERKYPTAPSTSDSEGEGKKVPKLSIKKSEEGMMKVQTLSEFEDSQSDSSEDDIFSDEAGNKQESGQFLLKIKKEKLASNQLPPKDSLSNLLRSKKCPSLEKRLMTVYRCLLMKTDCGRLVCELFKKRPSAKVYPEYYLVIKQPIDLYEIRDKIKTTQYSSMDEMMTDVELLVNNACTFNEEDSFVYADALVIRQVAQEAVQQIQQTWPELTPLSRPSKRKRSSTGELSDKGPGLLTDVPVKDVSSDVIQLYNAVKEYTDVHGRQVWRTLEKLPHTSVAGDYFTQIKKPIDMTIIHTKLSHGLYLTMELLFEDFNLLFDNTYRYFSKDTSPSKDALLLHGLAVKKYQELSAAERETHPLPNVKDCLQKLIREILTKTLNYKDASGHKPADGLLTLVATEEFKHPDVSEDNVIRRSLTLKLITGWVEQRRYPRLDQFQRDVLIVLREGRAEFGSSAYLDSVAMERQFIRVRDDMCKRGSLLWSPALSHTVVALNAELAWREEEHSRRPPTPVPTSPSSGSSSSDEDVSVTGSSSLSSTGDEGENVGGHKDEEEEEGVLIDKRDVEYMKECEFEGTVYQVGDVVYVEARQGSNREPHIVLVESLWKDKSDDMWLDGCWFYKPVETFHQANKKFYEKEVFKSDFRSIAKLSRVMGKCGVIFFRDYLKYTMEGVSDEDTYVCESRYHTKAKNFRKIKNWSLPGVQPPLLPREIPISLSRDLPSVFAPTVTHATPTTDTGDLSESDSADERMDVESVSGEGGVSGEDGEGGVDGVSGEGELSPEDMLEMSFSAHLKNVTITVPNPEPNCIYYEQYCIDDNYFRLGDFVFLRSDQDLAYIAKIDKMWTDANDDPWIHGPWFIRPRDVHHPPTRMFHERELFMSNIQDTNPMRSICGQCAVLTLTDFCKKRPTQYHDDDVYINESRYNEADKKTVKVKGLKHHQLSASVIPDEVYYFSKEIKPIKVPSPKLFTKEYSVDTLPPSSKEQTRASTPASGSSVASPATATLALQAQLANAVKKQQSQNLLNINPQLMQQLLASASKLTMTSKGPVVLPLQQSAVQSLAGPSSPTANVSTVQPPTNLALSLASSQTKTPTKQSKALYESLSCVCQWAGCGKPFQNIMELGTHLLTIGVHVAKEDNGNFYCKWKSCHRNPSIGGKPFNSVAKVTRHLREVHLLKISNSVLGLSPLTGAAIASLSSLTTPTTVTTPIVTPTPPVSKPVQLSAKESLNIARVIQSSNKLTPTAATVTDTTSIPGSSKDKDTVSSIFLPPPENRRKISHSAIYMKYIKGLQSNAQYMSSYKSSSELRASSKPPAPSIQASDWLGPDAQAVTKDNSAVVNALWALRDHLQRESTKLDKFTKTL